MNYEKEKCDGCALEIKADDDIVVCPECGTPQHRSCYEENKCCVNQHLHADGFVWAPTVKEEPKETENNTDQNADETQNTTEGNSVPLMQFNITAAEKACMRGVLYDPDDELDGMKVRDMAIYSQRNSARYIGKFMRKKKSRIKIGWNWAAFFFGPLWYLYRRLNKIGAVLLTLSIAITIGTQVISDRTYMTDASYANDINNLQTAMDDFINENNDSSAYNLESFTKIYQKANVKDSTVKKFYTIIAMRFSALVLMNIFCALMADYCYKKRMTETITLARKSANNNTAIFEIMRKGGVSFTSLLIGVAATMYLPDLIYYIADKIR